MLRMLHQRFTQVPGRREVAQQQLDIGRSQRLRGQGTCWTRRDWSVVDDSTNLEMCRMEKKIIGRFFGWWLSRKAQVGAPIELPNASLPHPWSGKSGKD